MNWILAMSKRVWWMTHSICRKSHGRRYAVGCPVRITFFPDVAHVGKLAVVRKPRDFDPFMRWRFRDRWEYLDFRLIDIETMDGYHLRVCKHDLHPVDWISPASGIPAVTNAGIVRTPINF